MYPEHKHHFSSCLFLEVAKESILLSMGGIRVAASIPISVADEDNTHLAFYRNNGTRLKADSLLVKMHLSCKRTNVSSLFGRSSKDSLHESC